MSGYIVKFYFVILFLCMPAIGWGATIVKVGKFSIDFPLGGDAPVVSFVYEGKKFEAENNGELEPIEVKKSASLLKEESFIMDIINANKTADRKKILKTWRSGERKEIEEKMNVKNSLERNKAYFKNIEESRILTVIRYSKYHLFCVEHKVKGIGYHIQVHPAVIEKGRYYLTNSLHGDMFYDHIMDRVVKFAKKAKNVNE